MVGAGFSRNGVPATASARPFPTWPQLTGLLSAALYPEADQTETATGTSGALRLAQEFEAVFGRFRLEEIIRGAVPDAEYHPGELHRRLLALPWADVFTTNWDTLIERARFDVHNRFYDVVLTQSQIPSASVPRIVKLHGTLPAHTPFIFTEEDYRTYPARFAPFVNLVQQAMMENAFVLLGFSGDDPNFLHWSGWVRDNLGAYAPKIYLVNWLALNGQRRRMLEERNVVPVDLAELPQAATWPPEMRHRFATEWFLHSMETGQPPRASAWPHPTAHRRPRPDHLGWVLPEVTPGTVDEPFPKVGPLLPIAEQVADFRSAVVTWTTNRCLYPGWFIAPRGVRHHLWQATTSWLGGISRVIAAMPERERLSAVRETLWRFEICLIGPEVVPGFPELLAATLTLVNLEKRTIRLTDGTFETLSVDEMEGVRRASHAMARMARHAGREEEFAAALDLLSAASRANVEAKEEVQYERLLWHAHRFEHDRLEQALDTWDVDHLDPIWGLRKAALLAGVGRLSEARFVLRNALARVRRERRRDVDDYASLSREAWGMWLTLAWEAPQDVEAGVLDDSDPFERWQELSLYDCNAFGDYQNLLFEMAEPLPTSDTSRERGFDLGQVSTRVHFRNGLPPAFRAALQMVRLAELTGLPSSANNVSLLGNGLSKAAELIADDQPLRGALLAMEGSSMGEDTILVSFFSRARIALLTPSDAGQLTAIAAGTFDYSVPRARQPEPRHSYWHTRLRVAVEILSRLVLRASPDEAGATLGRAEYLYRLGWPVAHHWMAGELGRLIKRNIESLPRHALLKHLPRLLDLPVPGTAEFLRQGAASGWEDPAAFIQPVTANLHKDAALLDLAVSPGLVARLLAAGREGPIARRFAVARLLVLRDLKALSSSEEMAFADVLWSEDGRGPNALPRNVGIFPWVFLLLPEPEPGMAERAFRHTYLRGRDERVRLGEVLRDVGYALWRTRLVLSVEDEIAVETLIAEWADRPDIPASPFASLERQDEKSAIAGLSLILTQHKFGADRLEKVWARAAHLEQGKTTAARPFALYPGLLKAFPERLGELAQRMRRGLVSADPDVASDALVGLYRWMEATQSFDGVPEVLPDLVEEVGAIIAARRRGVVAQALEIARWVFDEGLLAARISIVGNSDLGLSYLLTEASYESELSGGMNEGFDVALLRRNCVALALAIRRAGMGERAGVLGWIEVAATDPLPEIRNLVADARA